MVNSTKKKYLRFLKIKTTKKYKFTLIKYVIRNNLKFN